MSQPRMSQSVAHLATPPESSVFFDLSEDICEGLLQDLVAVGLILRHLQQTASDDARPHLASASATIDADVEVVRGPIERLCSAA